VADQTVAASRGTPAVLQPLLQLVARLPEIDAAQVKRWFELSRLIKQSKSENTASAAPDVFRVLKQFAERESLNRELSQVLQQTTRNKADGDTSATRAPVQDAQLWQMREVMKLADQSLSHNLLQRATLGLQQETQQPFSVSLALPFLENQAVKPIHIDLAERKQTQSEDDKSWDIRLSFELAGLGPIACHLVLEGRAIGASFYSEHELTRDRIEAELPLLRQQLSSAGFTPGEFHSFPGAPASLQPSSAPEFSESLVDIEA
jgi:flagellar hook-length control protein FliK